MSVAEKLENTYKQKKIKVANNLTIQKHYIFIVSFAYR